MQPTEGDSRLFGRDLSKSNVGLLQSLGVQKKGMKVQRSGGKRVAIAIPATKKGSTPRRGRQSSQKTAAPRRAVPVRNVAKPGGRSGGSGGRQRTVEMPRLADLRITIQNEKVWVQLPHLPEST